MIDNVARNRERGKNVHIKIRLRINEICRVLHGNCADGKIRWSIHRNETLFEIVYVFCSFFLSGGLNSCMYTRVNEHWLRRIESFIPFHAKWNVTLSPFLFRVVSLLFFSTAFSGLALILIPSGFVVSLYTYSRRDARREKKKIKKNSGSFS